jgi:lipopolysaccharide transport system permease protein
MSLLQAETAPGSEQEDAPEAGYTITITPPRGWVGLNLPELWRFRELLYFLTWRDLKVRYRQTAVGAAWAIIQPVLTMIIFSIFFGRLARVPSDGVPYPIFSYVALLPWQLFASSLSQSANSLVNSANLMRKVYFPRLIVPMASVLGSTVDFCIAFVVLIGLMLWYRLPPTGGVVLLPLFLVLALVTALGAGVWLSALNVQYRDIRYVVPFLVQFWLFATPVIYPSSMISEQWRTLYSLNPMVGVIEGFRWALLGTAFPGTALLISATVAIIELVGGIFHFRRVEDTFADIV